jgi:hypothetical protein
MGQWISDFQYLPIQFVIVATSIVAAVMATITILSSRKTARQKNATDLMMRLNEANHLKEGFDLLREIHHDDGVSIETYAKNPNENTEDEHKSRQVLNYYESLAAGIRGGIYDEKIVRDNRRSIIISVWEMTKPYIEKLRKMEKNEAYYEHLEWLVKCFCKQHPKWWCVWLICRWIKA